MSRVKLWALLLTSSIVTLVSLMAVLDERKAGDGWDRHEKWVVSVASISIGFSFLGCLASMLPEGQALKMESPLVSNQMMLDFRYFS